VDALLLGLNAGSNNLGSGHWSHEPWVGGVVPHSATWVTQTFTAPIFLGLEEDA